jgi:RNA polymerase sigma-70 factor (ECF subfamily)
MSDKELFLLVKEGDAKAYESIFKSFYQPLCQYANSLLEDIEESEEAVQQVFLNIWDKRQSIEIMTSVQSYLYRAVKNECLNKLRHRKIKRMYRKEVEYAGEEGTDITGEAIISAELQAEISAAVESLPEQCRIIFQLSRFEGKKYQEIADELGISPKTVENQIGKALRIMRQKLAEFLPLLLFILLNLNR